MKQPKKKPHSHPPRIPATALTTNRTETRLWSFIILALAFLLYANTIPHGYVLDDYGVLKDNWITKRGVDGIPLMLTTSYRYGVNMLTDDLYRPLSLVMFAIEWELAPNTPAISHFFNVLFYALSCLLLLHLLRKLFRNYTPLLPVLITLLWATHPIHTEVVANIKSRDEIMSVFFLFISCIWFIDFLEKKRVIFILGALFAYFLGFTSKEGIITMLAIFPLMGWYFTKADTRNLIIASLLMAIPAVLYLLIRHAVLSQYGDPSSVPVVDNLLVAAPDLATRLATAIKILGKYFLLLLFPVQLVSDYSYNQIPIVGLGNPQVWLAFLLYAGGLAFALLNLKKKSVLVFGILVYLVTFSVYSNVFVLIGSSFGERFLYLPSLGFSIILAWALLKVFRVPEHPDKPVPLSQTFTSYNILWLVFGLIIILYSIRTVVRNSEWKNQWELFSADINRSPDSAHLRYYWGLTLRDKAKEQENQQDYLTMMRQAADEFETGLKIYPKFSECHHQLGLAYFRLEDHEKALTHYNRAIELTPNVAVLYSNVAIIYFQRKEYQKAMELYQKAISIDPHYADAHMNLGSMYGMLGDYEQSLFHLKKSLEYDPVNANAYYYLGLTYQNMNNPEMANKAFEEAYRLNPKLKRTP